MTRLAPLVLAVAASIACVERPAPSPPETPARVTMRPEDLFVKHGCVNCHAKGAPFREKLKQSIGKPVEETAAWIRNPEKMKPGTKMPTFETLIDEEQAKSLAVWVQAEAAR